MQIEKPSTIAGYALNKETQGLPEDFYENYIKNINAVTAELYLADNVHPNDEGGKRVANVWGNALRENAEIN